MDSTGLHTPGSTIVCFQGEDGTGTGTAKSDEKPEDKNNRDITDLWSQNDDPDPDKVDKPATNDPAKKDDPPNIFAQYAESLQFPTMQLSAEDQEAIFENRDLSSLDKHVQDTFKQFAAGFLQDVTKIIKTSRDQAVQEAVDQSKTNTQSNELVNTLKDKYEYAKDPIVGPIAESAMARFLERGAKPNEAIDGVNRAMEHMFKTLTPHFSSPQQTLGEPPVNSAGSTPFGLDSSGEKREFDDWAALLRGDTLKST